MIGYKIAMLILISIFLIHNLYENKKIETFDNNFIKPSNWSELGFNQKLRIYGSKLYFSHKFLYLPFFNQGFCGPVQ